MVPDGYDIALEKDEHMTDVHILAIDLSKRSLQVCEIAEGQAVLFIRIASCTKLETVLRINEPGNNRADRRAC